MAKRKKKQAKKTAKQVKQTEGYLYSIDLDSLDSRELVEMVLDEARAEYVRLRVAARRIEMDRANDKATDEDVRSALAASRKMLELVSRLTNHPKRSYTAAASRAF